MRLVPAAVRFIVALLLCAAAHFVAGEASVRAASPLLPEPFDASAIDRGANACTDFFAYATGTYRKAHPIPAAYTEYGYIEQLEDRTRDIVRAILDDARRHPGTPKSNTQKIGTYYGTCMNTAAIQRTGLGPLTAELRQIAALRRADIPAELARLHALGVDAGFALNPDQDLRASSHVIGQIDQGGIGLPERDYYLRTDSQSQRLLQQYTSHVRKILALGGDAHAIQSARTVVGLETAFARASMPAAALREPEATYHVMGPKTIARLAPHLAFKTYLQGQHLTRAHRLNIAEPAFLQAVDRAVVSAPLSTWRRYLTWRLLDTYAPVLPAAFADESFAFREGILNGVKAQQPRWKRCVIATNAALGEAIGEAYVQRVFPRDAKVRALTLTVRIKHAYREEIAGLGWMSAGTRQIAIAKLTAMGLKVGYPTRWRDYRNLPVVADSYVANAQRSATFERRFALAKIDRPLDRTEWSMTPQTVNAYNDVQRNEIVLPAAQLQRPFFDSRVDDAANLGATGAGTIGHEMTHGFDDEGHKFDANGNLRNWWTPRDLASFNGRAHCVIRQFDHASAVGSLHYQGRLVSGEAIADLGGVVIGYHALESASTRTPIDGFSAEQRYFLAYAQSWTESVRPEAARAQALADPHPLPRDRVNLTLASVPAWYAAFNCPQPHRPICVVW